MKATSLIFVSLLIVTACGESKEKKENTSLKQEIEKLKGENASIKSGEMKMQATINDFNRFLKEIEQNLASVDQNKTMLAKLNSEKKDQTNVKADIKSHIAKIKELMENSKLKIIALDKSLIKLRKESGDKSGEILVLDRQVKALTLSLIDKDVELEGLGNELQDMEYLYEMELKRSAELWSIVNRAFYMVSTSKELKDFNVVTKEGGFIGLGRVKVLNANATDSLFTRIKKDETNEIILKAKKAKLITTHADQSFKIEEVDGKVNKLVILDRKLFWKEGNYLVVEVDK